MTMVLDGTSGITQPSGAAPAFSATQSSNQTISYGTATKVQFNTKEFDTNTNYDNTTNYRFTPTIAGYYLVLVCVGASVSGATYAFSSIYKNGTSVAQSIESSGSGLYLGFNAQRIIYFNGSTDYVEAYFTAVGSGTFTTSTGAAPMFFQASMVRSA